MVTNNKPFSQNFIKFLALGLIILLGVANSEKIYKDEFISADRFNNRLRNFNEWYSKFNPSAKVEARMGNDKKVHVYAKSALRAEETYMNFNRNLTINPDMVYDLKIGTFVKELEEQYGYDDYLNMVLFLVHEMANEKSEWKPYFDVLPRKIDTLAFNYWDRKTPIEEEMLHTPILSNLI